MKKSLKLFALALALVLVFALIASCQKTEEPAPTQTQTPTSAPGDPTVQPSEEPAPEPGNPKLPLADEPITFEWFRPIAQENFSKYGGFEENEGYKELAKRTGITIKFVSPVFGADTEPFNMMINSGDYTDLISPDSRGTYPGGFDKAIEDQVFLRINELVDKFAPNYKQLRESSEGYRKGSMTDSGNMPGFYSLMKLEGKPRPWGGLLIRQDWLDDLGMNMPITLDDWYSTLTAFKDQKGATAPLFMYKTGIMIGGGEILSAYDVGADIYQVDGTVKYGPIEPGFKEYLMLMNKWYSEGLIAPDFMTNQSPIYMPDTSYTTTGKSGIFWNVYLIDLLKLMSGNPNYELSAVPYPVKNVGDRVHFMGPAGMGDTATFSVAISTTCSDPELAARWADYQYSPDGYLLTTYGLEGVTYEMVNGQPKYFDTIEEQPFSEISGKYLMGNGSPCIWDFDAEYSMLSEVQIKLTDVWGDAERDYAMPAISLTTEEGERASVLKADIDTYVAEMILKFITGEETFGNYDVFLNQVRSMGIDEVIQINQTALDRYNAR
jgi:putative aldouronate transport system substrate-binding protein